MALAALMLILVAVSLLGVGSVIFMFIWDTKTKNNIAFLTASAICFVSTIFNTISLHENMSKAVSFAYIPSVLALVAIMLRYILNKCHLIAKLLICVAVFIGIFIAFAYII